MLRKWIETGAVAMLIGTLATLGTVLLVLRYYGAETPSDRLAFRNKRAGLVGVMRRHLANASEAEKSAVMAPTDRESQEYVDQARASVAAVEEGRVALVALLEKAGTMTEKALLAQFSRDFLEYRRVDGEVLDLAVKNSNLKAYALAYGPAADAIGETDGALDRVIAQAAASSKPNAKRVLYLAAGAQAAVLRIAAALPVHIAEESEARMDELEVEMATQEKVVSDDLAALRTLAPGDEARDRAAAGYVRFADLKKQILRLSRENTNVRSLLLSLNEKRRITTVCQEDLAALEDAIAGEPIPGPAQPR